MAKRIITVDIDPSGIRLLLLQGSRIERWGYAYYEPARAGEAPEIDPTVLGARIRRLMRATGMKGKRVLVSVSGQFSVTRNFNLDGLSRERVEDHLRQRIQEAIPIEGMRFQWQPLGDDADAAMQHVLVVGAPDALIQDYIQALKAAGLSPVAIETKGIALARAVGGSSAMVANVEPSSLDVVLVIEGVPQVIRSLEMPLALDDLGQAQFVARAVQQSLDYFQSARRGVSLPQDMRLVLAGSRGQRASLREAVSEATGLELASLDTGMLAPAHLPVDEYAVNLGLAMRAAGVPPSPSGADPLHLTIDLKPQGYRLVVPTWARAVAPVALVGLALVAFLFMQLQEERGKSYNLEQRLIIVERQVGTARERLTELTQMEVAIQQFQSLVGTQGDLTGVIEKVSALAPEGIDVSTYSATEANVSLSASAASSRVAIEYVTILRESGLFGKVDYSQTQTGAVALSLAGVRVQKPK